MLIRFMEDAFFWIKKNENRMPTIDWPPHHSTHILDGPACLIDHPPSAMVSMPH